MSSPFLKRFNCEWVNEIAVVLAVIFCAYSIYHSYQQAIHFKTEIIRISQKQVDAVAEQAKQQLEANKEQFKQQLEAIKGQAQHLNDIKQMFEVCKPLKFK